VNKLLDMNGNDILPTKRPPVVAIGCPSGDMVHKSFAMSLASLTATCAKAGIQVILTDARSSIVSHARSNCVLDALDHRVDYLLFLDSDMTFPRDTVSRLLAHRKDIVGGTYRKRGPPFETMGLGMVDGPIEVASGLVQMRRLPTGCMLIDMRVFAELKKPYFMMVSDMKAGVEYGEDVVFCDRARNAGFTIWCDVDLSMELTHVTQTHLAITDPVGPPEERVGMMPEAANDGAAA
jgi:hypothetical protein